MRKEILGITDDNGITSILYNGYIYNKRELQTIREKINKDVSIALFEDVNSNVSSSEEYRLVMCTILDNTQYYFEFDTISEVSISTDSELTTHPLVTGDILADHMYRNPAKMTVRGKFSLQGHKRYNYQGGGNRLSNIETIFERIKNEGILSKLITIKGKELESLRFKERDRMALTSISWTENINSLEFTFQFNEVLLADVQTQTYQQDVTDTNLPVLSDVLTLDFTDTFLDWDQVTKIVIQALQDAGLVSDEFLRYAIETAQKDALIGAGIGAVGGAIAAVVGLKVLASIGVALSVPVVGWIIGGVAIIGCIVFGLIAGIKSINRQNEIRKAEQMYKIEQFKLYEDDERNRQNVERFANYIGNIHLQLESLENAIQIYGIGENEPQECITYIDDKYYTFKFIKNNVSNKLTLTITSVNDNKVERDISDIESYALSDISQCTTSNHLFRISGSGIWVYLLNKQENIDISNNVSEEIREQHRSDLTNYIILVSRINMVEFDAVLNELVIDAMTR